MGVWSNSGNSLMSNKKETPRKFELAEKIGKVRIQKLYIRNANIIMCGMEPHKTDFLENISDWSKIYYENCTISDRR